MVSIFGKRSAPSVLSAVDERLDQIRAQLTAAASEQASLQASIDGLLDALRLAVENGDDTSEVESKIMAERVKLERLALRHSMLERVAREKAAALQEKRHRLRVEALEQAEGDGRADLAAVDEEIKEDLLRVAEKFSKRAKMEHDLFGVSARLQHLTGTPRGMGALAWDEAPLVAEFLRRHQELATRTVPFGEQAWNPFTLTLPTLTPSRTTAALVADDESTTP